MNRKPLTADTITDEQIRELAAGQPWYSVISDDVQKALYADDLCARQYSARVMRHDARARCAEILNARAAATP